MAELKRKYYSYKCLVRNCSSTNLSGAVMVPHPKPLVEPVKCMRWLKNMKREDMDASCIKKNSYICGLHWVGGKGPTVDFPDPTLLAVDCDIQHPTDPTTTQHEQVQQIIYVTTTASTTCTISVSLSSSSSSYSCTHRTSCTQSSMSVIPFDTEVLEDVGLGILPDKSPVKNCGGVLEMKRPQYPQIKPIISPNKRRIPEPEDIFCDASPKKRKDEHVAVRRGCALTQSPTKMASYFIKRAKKYVKNVREEPLISVCNGKKMVSVGTQTELSMSARMSYEQ